MEWYNETKTDDLFAVTVEGQACLLVFWLYGMLVRGPDFAGLSPSRSTETNVQDYHPSCGDIVCPSQLRYARC